MYISMFSADWDDSEEEEEDDDDDSSDGDMYGRPRRKTSRKQRSNRGKFDSFLGDPSVPMLTKQLQMHNSLLVMHCAILRVKGLSPITTRTMLRYGDLMKMKKITACLLIPHSMKRKRKAM